MNSRYLAILALGALSAGWAFAQTGEMRGTVKDGSGAAIPHARVEITNAGTKATRLVDSNDDGLYTVSFLIPGDYSAKVTADGFQTLVREGLKLEVGQRKNVDFDLQLGQTGQSITVNGDTGQINLTDGSVSTVVSRELLENVPLNGRGFNALLELTPGVTLAKTNYNSQGQFNVNGQRASSNYFSIDGVSANTGVTGGLGLNQTGAGTLPVTNILGGMNALVSADALQEFRVQTSSFAPEYGRTPGAQISIATRSGTNQFHGDLFDYLRNDKLDANDWFSNQKGIGRSPERQNDFGGVAGGPILPDRTFFFVSYEGLRLVQPQNAIGYSVPSLDARRAAPASLQPYINAFPLPNGPVLTNGFSQFNAGFSTPSNFDAISIRVDHTIGRAALFLRYADSPSSTIVRGGTYSMNTVNSKKLSTRSLTAGSTSMISSVLTNEFRFNWSNTTGRSLFALDDFGGAQVPQSNLLSPYAPEDSQFTFNLTSGAYLVSGKNATNYQQQWNPVDTISATFGKHSIKSGIDVRALLPISDPAPHSVSANFAGVGNPTAATQANGTALSGLVSSGSVATQISNFGLRYLDFSVFLQDSWKVTSRLTITYGLRWDIAPPPHATSGGTLFALTGVDTSNLAVAPKGTALWQTAYHDVAPRLGMVYRIRSVSGAALVLRVGGGTFYDLTSGGLVASQTITAPNTNLRSLPAQTLFPYDGTALTPPPLPATPPFSSAYFADPNLAAARTYQWNGAIEQELGPSRSITATYSGAIGHRLDRAELLQNPNPLFRALIITRSDASSNYQSLQLGFRGQIRSSLSALVSYTWAHSIDNMSADTISSIPDLSLNRGPSDFDVRHSSTAALIFTPRYRKGSFWSPLLSGWGLDAMFRARTALPLDVTVLRDLGYGSYLFRPDVIPGAVSYLSNANAGGGQQVNPNAFLVSTALRQGTLGRNVIRGFGMYQADLTARREFPLSERFKLQLRAELFNATNHPNFGDPLGQIGSLSPTGVLVKSNTFGLSNAMLGRTLGSGGIGLSSLYQAGGPRSIQLSLKLLF